MRRDSGKSDSAVTICYRMRSRAEDVASVLQTAGYQVSLRRDGPLNLGADGVMLLLGNANWYPVICRQLAARPQSERPFTIVWHSEPLPPPAASGLPWPRLSLQEIGKILLRDATDSYTNYFRLRSLVRKGIPDVLVISTRGAQQFLAERGIAAHWAPLGYPPSYGRDLGLPRDIDVLFLGAFNIPRRRRLIDQLRRRGINLLALGSRSNPDHWGENRTQLLNRTKILLNLQRSPGELSGMRFLLGMANRTLVISEPVYDSAPYVPGKHYISATIEEMPQIIRYYLAHEEEREKVAREGHRFVTQEMTLDRSVAQILELISAQREQSLTNGSRELKGSR